MTAWRSLLLKELNRGLSHSVQVLASSWVSTRGGLVPKLLNPNVARGAANVASVRRLRNLVHGAIALKSLRALKVRSRSFWSLILAGSTPFSLDRMTRSSSLCGTSQALRFRPAPSPCR